MVQLDGSLRKALLAGADLETLTGLLAARGHMTLRHHAQRLVSKGITTLAELTRICGQAGDA